MGPVKRRLLRAIGRGAEVPSRDIGRAADELESVVSGHSASSAADRRSLEETMYMFHGEDDGSEWVYGRQKFQPLPSGLGDEADRIIALSPSLSRRLTQIQYEDWIIGRSEPGTASRVDHDLKAILLDPELDGPAAIGELAHWIGHVHRRNTRYWSTTRGPFDTDDEEWANGMVTRHLSGEAHASLERCQAREEILREKGPDIGFDHPLAQQYWREFAPEYLVWEMKDQLARKLGEQSAIYPHATPQDRPYRDALHELYTEVVDNADPDLPATTDT